MKKIAIVIYFLFIQFIVCKDDTFKVKPIDMRYYDEVNCGRSDFLHGFELSVKQTGFSFAYELGLFSSIPWMARIVDHNNFTICNGVLVTQLHVLTNFGCLKGIEEFIKQQSEYNHLYGRYQVRIGEQSTRDVCDSDSDGIFNCSSKVFIRYINDLHLPYPVLNDGHKYGVIELNRPITSIPHACIYHYQMDFLGLEEQKKVENVISLLWGIDRFLNLEIFQLIAYFFKETFDYKNKTFADSFGCKYPEDYQMIKEDIKSMPWINIFKGAPLFRRVKDNQFGVYGIGEGTCLKNSNKIKHPQELFFHTLNSAQDFLFNSLNEVNHDKENVENGFYDISKFYDKDTCGKIQKENIPYNTESFTNEVSYPWILTIAKGGRACMGTLISKMHVITSYECIYNILKVETKILFKDRLKGVLVMQSKKNCTAWKVNEEEKVLSGNKSDDYCNNFDIQYREAFQVFHPASSNDKDLNLIIVLKEPFQDVPHVCVDENLDPFNDNEIVKKYLVYQDTVLSDNQKEIVYLAEYNLTQVTELKLGLVDHEIFATDDNYKYICGTSTGSSIFLESHNNVHYLYEVQKGFDICNDRTNSFYYSTDYDFIKTVFKILPMTKYDTSPFVYNLKKLQYYDYKNCGKSNNNIKAMYEFFISGGYDVHNIKDIPWAVQIINKNRLCSGVLVSHRHVITAAHCISIMDDLPLWYYDKDFLNDAEIIIGSHCNEILNDDGECINKGKLQKRRVNRLLYNFKNGLRRHKNDIAVIELDVPVVGVTHICLPFLHNNYKFDERKTLITFGYGRNKNGPKPTDENFNRNLKRFVYTMPNSIKNCSIQRVPVNSTESFCLNVNANLGLCHGDSGGGLIQKMPDNRYILVGVNSRGKSCMHENFTVMSNEGTNVFTLVEEYKDEIINFMHETKTYYPKNS